MSHLDLTKTCIVLLDEDGNAAFLPPEDGSVNLIIIDDRTPHDRVYQTTLRMSVGDMKKLIGDSEIGSSSDDRHQIIEHRINSYLEGKKHLTVVDGEKDDVS